MQPGAIPTSGVDGPRVVAETDRATLPTGAHIPVRGPVIVLGLAIVLTLWPGSPVPLLTGPGVAYDGISMCYTSFASGELTLDAAYGTAIVESDHPIPVMWPDGYTGRRSGSQVEVVDKSGHVVARTGTRVRIEGGFTGDSPRAFLACGYVLAQ